MTSRGRLRSESLPAMIPEIILTDTSANFQAKTKANKQLLAPPHYKLSKSEEHLPSIRHSDSVVKGHFRGGKKDKLIHHTLSKSEEHLPFIINTRTVGRRHSTPKNGFLGSRGAFSNKRDLDVQHGGKKRHIKRDKRTGELTKPKETPEADHSLSSISQEHFLLPPLPTGSLTYQTALKDHLHESDNSSASDDSGSEVFDGYSFNRRDRRRRPKPKLAWYGPLVEYKGHQIYLSTLNTLKTNAELGGRRHWCC